MTTRSLLDSLGYERGLGLLQDSDPGRAEGSSIARSTGDAVPALAWLPAHELVLSHPSLGIIPAEYCGILSCPAPASS